MSDLVGNPENRFSRDAAQITISYVKTEAAIVNLSVLAVNGLDFQRAFSSLVFFNGTTGKENIVAGVHRYNK